MSKQIVLALPCRLTALTLQLGPDDGVTTLEDLVVQAVTAGRSTVASLAELFVLPRRILLDAVHTLWSRGYLNVDFDTGELYLSDGTREQLAADGSLRSASIETKRREYLYEPITGRIFPASDGHAHPAEGSVRLPLDDGVSEADLPHLELLRAVQRAVRDDRRSGFRRTVLGVSFGNPLLRAAEQVRWLANPASALVDPDTDRVIVDLLDDRQRRWGEDARTRLRTYLADLIEKMPDSEAAVALRGRARRELAEPESTDQLLARMAGRLDDLGRVEASQVELKQQELKQIADQIADRLDASRLARASLTVVERGEGHRWALEDILLSAQRQVVIAMPTIAYDLLNQALPSFEEALSRGVRIALMWGHGANETLPRRVHTALFGDLAARYRLHIMIADRSANISASVIIQDNVRAFVGAHSPLATSRDGRELGVLVEPDPRGPAVPECVVDLLIWARRTWPRWLQGQRIRMQREDFPRLPGADDEAAAPVARRFPQASGGAPESIQLWAESWQEQYEALMEAKTQLADAQSTVEVVSGGRHRDLLWQALNSARTRLVLADDRIRDQGVEDRFVRALRSRADAGVAVHLVHPLMDRESPMAAALAQLAERPDGAFTVEHKRSGSHIVVADKQVLIGSFPVLEDGLAPGAGGIGGPNHLGLLVNGGGFADRIILDLGGEVPAQGEQKPSLTPARQRRGASAALAILAEARAAHEGFGPYVAECLRTVDGPAEVLEVWESVKLPDDELRPAAAALVRLGDRVEEQQRMYWTDWLARNAWQRRSFMEAALLGRALDDQRGGLSAAVCTAAAALDCGPLGSVLTNAALELSLSETAPSGARTVCAVGGLAETLLWAGTEGHEVIGLHQQALAPAWLRLADAAVEYWHETHTPLPLEALTAEAALSERVAEEERRWEKLDADIEKIRRLRRRFEFESGQAMHDGLFAADGLFTRIHEAAGDGEARAGLPPRLPADVRHHLDQLVAAAGYVEIQWHRQRTFLEQVEAAVREARTLSASTASSGRDPRRNPSADRARVILGVVAESWEELYSEARLVPDPYIFPTMALLDRLGPLAQRRITPADARDGGHADARNGRHADARDGRHA